MKPARGVTFIKRIETEERIGSIYAPQQTVEAMTQWQFEVVEVGKPEWCEEEIPCDRLDSEHAWEDTSGRSKFEFFIAHPNPPIKPGDWVLVKPRSWVGTDDPEIYALRTSDVLGVFVLAEKVKDGSRPSRRKRPAASR